LDAGAHRSSAFQPSLTYTTPAGWANVVDTPTIFKLDPDSTADPSLILWSNVAIPTGCDAVVKPGTGRKVTDFVNYLTSHPGIDVLSSKPITVAHFSAREMDLAVKPSWTQTCPGIPGFTVQFILDTDPQAGAPIYGLTSNGHMRIVLLEVHGRTVIIQAYGPTSEPGFADAMAKVQPLLDSFEFTLGG